jgi:hypothetical protein
MTLKNDVMNSNKNHKKAKTFLGKLSVNMMVGICKTTLKKTWSPYS